MRCGKSLRTPDRTREVANMAGYRREDELRTLADSV